MGGWGGGEGRARLPQQVPLPLTSQLQGKEGDTYLAKQAPGLGCSLASTSGTAQLPRVLLTPVSAEGTRRGEEPTGARAGGAVAAVTRAGCAV